MLALETRALTAETAVEVLEGKRQALERESIVAEETRVSEVAPCCSACCILTAVPIVPCPLYPASSVLAWPAPSWAKCKEDTSGTSSLWSLGAEGALEDIAQSKTVHEQTASGGCECSDHL